MAINTNPTYKAGQKLDSEQLKALLALRDNGPQWGETTGDAGGHRYEINEWSMPGKFGAVVARDPATGKTLIYQPRNVSTWGGNDTSDVWDDQGNYVGISSGATDLRSLARLAAAAAASYYAAGATFGAEGAGAGAAAGGADAATSAAWGSGAGLGGDTLTAMGATGTTGAATGGMAGAGTLSVESLGAIEGLSSLGTEIGSIGADSIISGTQAATAGGTAGTAGLSSLDKAALYGAEGYGTGMTGAQTSVYDGVLGATGSTELAGALSGNEAVADVLNSVVDGAKTVTSGNGFDTLGKVVTTAIGAGAGADALSNPVDTSRFDQLFSNLLAEQGKSSARAEDEWQNYINTWRPIQQKLADAVTNFDTAGRREMAAQEATGEVATQFDRQRVDAGKRMVAAGVDPSTIAALDASSRIDEAKIQAGAANKARSDIEMQGLSLLQGGANFGRNVANTSAQQSSIATGTTGTANSVLNTQGNLQNQNTANNNALVGDLFQTGMQLWGLSDAKKTGTGG